MKVNVGKIRVLKFSVNKEKELLRADLDSKGYKRLASSNILDPWCLKMSILRQN